MEATWTTIEEATAMSVMGRNQAIHQSNTDSKFPKGNITQGPRKAEGQILKGKAHKPYRQNCCPPIRCFNDNRKEAIPFQVVL
jgi:hypothetical protein